MYEVEVKVAVDDPDAVRAALERAGAERVETVVQRDTYLDAPHRDFAETDEALRVRRETAREASGERNDAGRTAGGSDEVPDEYAPADTVRLTYKGPLVESASKTREEFETRVADGHAVAELFDRLGFDAAATVRKRRERYRLDGYAVVLDAVDGLGTFLEVETAVEAESDVADAREGALALLRRLGLDPDDQVRTSYLGLLLSQEN